jgi:hypothetical protein
MAKRAKMQRVVMSILATMFVASLVLAVVSFVWPAPVSAEHYQLCSRDCGGSRCDGHLYCMYKKWTVYHAYGYHCTDIVCEETCWWSEPLCP